MKNILICLETLGIGGVETFAITQIEELTKQNVNCFVFAKNGILSQKLKNNKRVKLYDFDFELKNELEFNKSKKIEEVIVKEKIDLIIVHQYPCIVYVLQYAMKYNIPYISYLHNIVPGTFDWYMNTFPLYKSLFPIFFRNASKIIAIADIVKNEHKKLFKVEDSRYEVINNSLNFSHYPDKKDIKIPDKYKKLLLFGRITEVKKESIDAAVNFYKWCKKNYNEEMELSIAGDGDKFDEIKDKYKGLGINFLGAVSDLSKIIEESDILLGVDRCALESVASKKPTIICSYNKTVTLITPKNIETCINENFSGFSLKDNKGELFSLSKKQILDIIEENYKIVKKRLSIDTKAILDVKPIITMNEVFKQLNIMNSDNLQLNGEVARLNGEIKGLNERIESLTNELNAITSSKRWKIINKIGKIKNKITRRR